MFKEIIGSFFIVFFSILLGFLFNDKGIGIIILSTGLLNIWLAILKRNFNYIFGSIFHILNAYISYINGLYGIAFLSIFVYLPLQIDGFFRWKKDVPIKTLSQKVNIYIIISLISTTIGLSFLLNKINSQTLSILDSGSNITNICGIIMMNLKYQEAWKIWLINNYIDLIIWMIKSLLNAPNAKMMMIVSIGYLLMNIYGLKKWKKS